MIRVEYRNRVGDADIERIIEVGDISQLTVQERAVVIGLPVRISESVCEDCCAEREEVDNSTTEERMNDMQFDQVGAIMFYDKDNALVGSVGVESGTYTEEQIESIAQGALMDVFSSEEVKRIAYFTVETHHLIPYKGECTEPEGQGDSTTISIHPTEEKVEGISERRIELLLQQGGSIEGVVDRASASHVQNLVEHGLFEKDFYIKHKLEALRILHGGESFKVQQSLIVKSLMSDLGIDNEECGVNTSEFDLK
ncbi:hypothetical protein MKX34_26810 [Paenibacillus sp. FSL R5-0636]|uniref:hypothetical protein n=1 Tax=Paenibacillus TaxID=44249 RepID=UPI00096C7BC2|nr:hypothetical protein [Paenibacillus odorifer]OMD00032.1 hypothetical protein BJP49_28465 [Paenibacillus odorifer]